MPGLASDQGPIFVFQLVLVTIFVSLHFSVLCAHLFTYIPVNRRACTTMDKKKKRIIPEIRDDDNAVPHVISCSITRDQRRAKVADGLALR